MSYRRKLENLLYRSALDKSRAEKYPRLESRLERTKFTQRYRKRLPNLPFPPARLKRFEENTIARLLRRGFRRDRKAKKKYGEPIRELYRDRMKKLERRALKRRYDLLPFSVKLERELGKDKFAKKVKAERKKRRKAFRKLSLQELRRSGLTETEVQQEIDRRLAKLAAPEFPELGADPEFFPEVKAEEPDLPEIGPPPSPPPGGIPFLPLEEEEEQIFGPMAGEEEGEEETPSPRRGQLPSPIHRLARPLRVEEGLPEIMLLAEEMKELVEEISASRQRMSLAMEQGLTGEEALLEEEVVQDIIERRDEEEEEMARQRQISLTPEQLGEMARQRTAEEIAGIERREAAEQIEQERRDVPRTRGMPPVPIAREKLPETVAFERAERFRAMTEEERTADLRKRIKEMKEVREPAAERREEKFIKKTKQILKKIKGESATKLLKEVEELGKPALEKRLAFEKELEDIARRQLEAEEEGEFEMGKRLKKLFEGEGAGLISGKYDKETVKNFMKQLKIQVDIFRLERERRAKIHERPIESIAAEALERSGRKPNKYLEVIKKVKKAYPHISDKDALKGGRESFGEGKKYKKKSAIRGEASRIAALTNPWIIHLKKVMPGLKRKYPKRPHKFIMKMVKETYTPVKKSKKKGGEILPALMVAAGKKKKSGMEKHIKKIKKKYPNLSEEQCMMIAKRTYKNPKAMKKVKKLLRGGDFFGIST